MKYNIYNFNYDEDAFKNEFKKVLEKSLSKQSNKRTNASDLAYMMKLIGKEDYDEGYEGITKVYRGINNPSYELLAAVCQDTNVSIQDVLLPNSQCEIDGKLIKNKNPIPGDFDYECFYPIDFSLNENDEFEENYDGIELRLKVYHEEIVRYYYLMQKMINSYLSYGEKQELFKFIEIFQKGDFDCYQDVYDYVMNNHLNAKDIFFNKNLYFPISINLEKIEQLDDGLLSKCLDLLHPVLKDIIYLKYNNPRVNDLLRSLGVKENKYVEKLLEEYSNDFDSLNKCGDIFYKLMDEGIDKEKFLLEEDIFQRLFNQIKFKNAKYDCEYIPDNLSDRFIIEQCDIDEIAKITKSGTSTVRTWKDGLNVPQRESLLILAQRLGCSIDDFFVEFNSKSTLLMLDEFTPYIEGNDNETSFKISNSILKVRGYVNILRSYNSYRAKFKCMLNDYCKDKEIDMVQFKFICNKLKVAFYDDDPQSFYKLFNSCEDINYYLELYKNHLLDIENGDIVEDAFLGEIGGTGFLITSATNVMFSIINKNQDVVIDYVNTLLSLELDAFLESYLKELKEKEFKDKNNEVLKALFRNGARLRDAKGNNSYDKLKELLLEII